MTKCPLCESERSYVLRDYDLRTLRKMWKDGFGFDPFPEKFESSMEKRKCIQCDLLYFTPAYFGDSSFYAKMSHFPFYYEKNKWEFDVALKFIAKSHPSSLLEIGCGDGSFLQKVRGTVTNIEGIDINNRAIDLCRAKGLNVSNAPMDLLNKKFDMVVSFEVLEHMDDPRKKIEDMLGLLSPNGVLIVAVPNPDGYWKDFDITLLDMPPHHNTSWHKTTFDYVAECCGLKILAYEQEPLRYAHYTGALFELIRGHSNISPKTFKHRLFFKLQTMVVQLFAPLTFHTDRAHIIGQTHLVVFRKK